MTANKTHATTPDPDNAATPRTGSAVYRGIYMFRSPSQRVFSPTQGPETFLIVMLAGIYRAEYQENGQPRTFEARAGDIMLWPQGKARLESNDPSQPMQCLVIAMARDPLPKDKALVVHDHQGIIRRLANVLLEIRAWPSSHRIRVQNGYMAGILAEYERLSVLAQNDLENRMIRYIEEHIKKPIRLGDLARHAGYHKHHFIRKYKACTSRTPMDDVRRIRAEYARDMLASPQRWTLRQIAHHIGVTNEFQVSRLIRRYIGIPVRDLRH